MKQKKIAAFIVAGKKDVHVEVKKCTCHVKQ